MLQGSSADFYGPESCRSDPGYKRTSPSHVDRCRNTVYAAAYRNSSRSPCRMDCRATAILPLQLAAKEAWMSIKRVALDHGPLAVLENPERPRLGRGP